MAASGTVEGPGVPADSNGRTVMTISDLQVQQYLNDGFLIVEDLLTDNDLQPVMDELEEVVDEWAEKLHRAGKISEKHANEGLFPPPHEARGAVAGRRPARAQPGAGSAGAGKALDVRQAA